MLKTKKAQKLLDPMINHLNKLSEMLAKNNDETTEISLKKSALIEGFNRLIKIMFDEFSHYSNDEVADIQTMKSNIIQSFDELFSKEFHEENMMKIFIDKFKSVLKIQEKLESLEMKRQIQVLHDYIKDMGEAQQIEHYLNIKELAVKLLEMFQLLLEYGKNLISELLKDKIILCIHQLYVSFKMLSNLVKEQHKLKLPIFHTKKYLCNRICVCLDKINEILDAPNPTIDDENAEKFNHFVHKMDLALDLITELTGKNQKEQIIHCTELWPAIEDVFSYAMSIAQVCQPENFEEITNICQVIITEYENLKNQLSSEPREIALNGLFIKTTTDALYRLERQINISVLTLVKNVFSDPFCALAKIIDMCGSSLSPEIRSSTDITADIEHFDGISDEIMQIGFYAMACCRDINRVSKIKNIMANLESIELELIPTITMFYLNPQNEELRTGAKLLTDQWQKDVREFRTTVEVIIDPAAFSQVVLDDLEERVRKMNYCLDHRIPIISQDVKTFVLRACTLAMQITLTINDIGEEKINKQTLMMIRELKAAVYEASAAEKRFRSIIMTDPEQLRVIKRCELLINVVRRLQPALVTVMNDWDLENSVELSTQNNYNSSRSKNELSFIKTPYTIKNFKLPISIQTPNIEAKTPLQRSCLIPYIKQGRTMRLERSILYRNPPLSIDNKSSRINNRNLSCVRQHLFSRNSSIASQCQEIDWTNVSYDLTCILSELSVESSKIDEINSVNEINSSTIGGGGDAPSTIETPQRIADIQQLDKIIDKLQKYNVNK
ncbi:hypothetical protein PV326_014374 [Microctonus aethiopoides]|nr:hypothetical protein PV326_014374 [Microctonus aethiopoides]